MSASEPPASPRAPAPSSGPLGSAPRATVIAIGNELLAGRTADSNFVELARLAGEMGVRFVRHLTIGDGREEIRAALEAEAPGASLIVLSGGLGPTADDLTRDALADFAGVPLVEHEEVAARLAARYAALGRTFSGTARRQALLPQGVELLPNPVGLAPGLWLETRGTMICALPGVPGEFLRMVRESLLPRLAASGHWPRTVTAVLRTVGLPESEVADRVEGVARSDDAGRSASWEPLDLTGVELAYLPHAGMVDLRIVGHGPAADSRVAAVERQLAARLGQSVYAHGERTMAEVVGALLRARGLRVALAESCTGGLLGAELTAVPGSSDYFVGGVVAYSNVVKMAELGVPEGLLAAHGAVSGEVAAAMASGVRTRFSTELGLAVTGIAGPGGGTAEKPVGLVYLGLATAHESSHRRLMLSGSRELVRERAALYALDLLRRHLL